MENKIILTISLLVSNRPDTVEKCLKSLDNIRNKIPNELILVDTGCGEQVRSIIEKYTDNIVEFEWCNDFSKARNAGLEKAKGEWFLYLDDDEWFEDTTEIEDFFLSGEYKKYSMADYKQRNYSNPAGTIYSDAPVRRMTRIEPITKFVYSIHEVLTIVPGKRKTFDSYVHHYGYVYKSKEDFYKHSERNITPLLKELEKEPYELHHHIQIAQEYNVINELYKSIEISLRGIECYDPEKTSHLYLNGLMVNVVKVHSMLYQYEKAVEYAEKFWKHKYLIYLAQAKLSYLLSLIHYELKNYEKVLFYVQTYEKLYKKQVEDKDIYANQSTIFLEDTFQDKVVYSTFCNGVQAAIQLKKTKEAIHFFSYLDLGKKSLMLEKSLLEAVCQGVFTTDGDSYIDMLNQLLERKELLGYLIGYLEQQRLKNKQAASEAGSRWEKIKEEHWYFTYLKLLGCDDVVRRRELLNAIWNNPVPILKDSVELELWDVAQKDDIDMYEMIESIPYYKWKQAVMATYTKAGWTKIKLLNEKIDSVYRDEKFMPHFLFWKMSFLEKNIREIQDMGEVSVEFLFQQYANKVEEYYKAFYKDEMMEQNPEFMPIDYQAAVCIKKVQEYINALNYKAAIEQLKTLKELCPDFSKSIKQYLQNVNKSMKQKEKEENEIKDEMAYLARTLKFKIRTLINQNYYEQALQIIQQLESFIGEDEELRELKEQALLKG